MAEFSSPEFAEGFHAGETGGMFAVYGDFPEGVNAAQITHMALTNLQHRGERGAGIAATGGEQIKVEVHEGLLINGFDGGKRLGWFEDGHIALGHVHHGTHEAWDQRPDPADVLEPRYYLASEDHDFVLSYNGKITNTNWLIDIHGLNADAMHTDLHVASQVLGQPYGQTGDLTASLLQKLPELEGPFSLIAMDGSTLAGVRDRRGTWPLLLGKLKVGEGYVLTSETPALDIINADFVREIEPGEMVTITDRGVESYWPYEKTDNRFCLVEFTYAQRPDSYIMGKNVHSARVRMGEALADIEPVSADMVVGVPDTGIPAAEGYAKASGIPFGQGYVKNRYVARFDHNPGMRETMRQIKLSPLHDNVAGRRLVVVDDSIMKGVNTRRAMQLLRDAGAAEIHLRIASPPVTWPCAHGRDTGPLRQLIAAQLRQPEIADYLGVDSLAHLDLGSTIKATELDPDAFCTDCVDHDFSTPVKITRSH